MQDMRLNLEVPLNERYRRHKIIRTREKNEREKRLDANVMFFVYLFFTTALVVTLIERLA